MLKRICVTMAMMAAVAVQAQERPTTVVQAPGSASYLVFLQQRPVGRETVAVVRDATGWTIRGTSQLGGPIDITTGRAEIKYDTDWRPLSAVVESVARGQELQLRTSFADGKATNEIFADGKTTTKVDPISAQTIVLPNTYLGSYAALAQRLAGQAAGGSLVAYVAPQLEVPVEVVTAVDEVIETPRESIAAVHYTLKVVNPAPAGAIDVMLWASKAGDLLRMSIPGQQLEMVREDIASPATRTAQFTLPGDERVTIPALGFNIAGTLTRPANATGKLPAVVLVGGSGPTDRDETVFGIPVFGHLARGLVEAGFIVVRYDKRGVGQTGGRPESAALADFAEDARTVVRWLEKQPGVDKDRLALVGHSEGAAVSMLVAARENRVKAVVLIAGPGTTGAELILEQQRHALDLMKATPEDRAAKTAMQEQIHAAVLTGGSWEGIPEAVRRAADTALFQSILQWDPARVMKDVDQPVLIVQGELDTQVPPHHADKLMAMAQARKKKVDAQLLKVPGVNHLLVPAKTGEVAEYRSLGTAEVLPAIPAGIGAWLAKSLGPGKP